MTSDGSTWSLLEDTKVFKLLFNENISYGFRRNVLGLRIYGVIVALAVALLSTGVAVERYIAVSQVPSIAVVFASVIAWIAAGWWTFGFKPDWVRIPADQYAMHLLAACTALADAPRADPPPTAVPAVV